MNKLDPRDFAILFKLMQNARMSDREIAKMLECSQPTVSRRRTKLEKDVVKGYTAIPDLAKIGYNLVAFTFIKSENRQGTPEEIKRGLQTVRAWYKKHPNVVFALEGHGMGFDAVAISFHKNFSDFTHFIRKHRSELSEFSKETQTFLADVNPGIILKPFHLKYLADTKQQS